MNPVAFYKNQIDKQLTKAMTEIARNGELSQAITRYSILQSKYDKIIAFTIKGEATISMTKCETNILRTGVTIIDELNDETKALLPEFSKDNNECLSIVAVNVYFDEKFKKDCEKITGTTLPTIFYTFTISDFVKCEPLSHKLACF